MKTTFVNKSLPMSSLTGKFLGSELNLIGNIVQIAEAATSFKEKIDTLDKSISKRTDRLMKETNELKDLVEDLFSIEYYSRLPMLSSLEGRVDNIMFFQTEPEILELDACEVKGLNKNLSLLEVAMDPTVKGNSIYYSFKKKSFFTEFYFKVANSQQANCLIINKKINDVVSVKVRDYDGTWQEILQNSFLTENISPTAQCFFDLNSSFSQEDTRYASSNEFKVIVKNNKVGNRYYTNINLKLFKNRTGSITSRPIMYSASSTVSSLSLDSYDAIFFSGHLKAGNKSYSIQIPNINLETNLALSKLELIEKQQTYSILRCPFPVEIDSELALDSISLSSSLSNSSYFALNTYIQGFQVSTDKNNWFTLDQIASSATADNFYYPTEYSTTPKYFYIKVDSLPSDMYMFYTLKKNINCAWPLSSDEEIFFNGTGISLKTPTKDFKITGKVNGIIPLNISVPFFPIAKLGVD
jgi:hypothetical protein